jgi:uncharacterized protein HemX
MHRTNGGKGGDFEAETASHMSACQPETFTLLPIRRTATMQDPSSPVSSGNISPAIVGPSKDTKEVYLIGGLVVVVAIIIGAFWYYSGQDQPYASKNQSEPLTNAQVTQVLKTSTIPPAEAIAHSQTVPAVRSKSDSTQIDIFSKWVAKA